MSIIQEILMTRKSQSYTYFLLIYHQLCIIMYEEERVLKL